MVDHWKSKFRFRKNYVRTIWTINWESFELVPKKRDLGFSEDGFNIGLTGQSSYESEIVSSMRIWNSNFVGILKVEHDKLNNRNPGRE